MGSLFSAARTNSVGGGGGGGGGGGDHHSDGNSRVIQIRSKSSWDEHWNANRQDPNKMIVIDFTASWCGPCRSITPTFEAFSAKYTDVLFLKVDVDDLPDISQQWKVSAMPTFVVVKGGKEVARIVGAKKNELETTIQQHLN